MKILGMVASFRKYGNSEIAVKEALLGAEEAGAETKLLRLTDYNIKPCTGCMRCVFKKKQCPLQDDVETIHKEMAVADAFYFRGSRLYPSKCRHLKDAS